MSRGVPEWMLEWLPAAVRRWADWLLSPEVLAVLALSSVVLFVASVLAVPAFVVRVPADHFAKPWRRGRWISSLPPWQRGVLLVLKNIAGAVLFAAGVAMLVLPGQGVITIVAALLLLDVPGKHALERRIVMWPPVWRALNALRRRARREPLEPPPP